jgi:hypothetical protein
MMLSPSWARVLRSFCALPRVPPCLVRIWWIAILDELAAEVGHMHLVALSVVPILCGSG